MGKTVQKDSEQNSTDEHSLNNGTVESRSNWSRCNSFSSSSNDSSVFCTSYLQKPIYPVEEKLSSEEDPSQQHKRRRNSSGSSASSNLSSNSDKDIKKMPVLISTEPISSIKEATVRSIGNLTDFSNLNSSSLTLQHKTLFGNNLPRSMKVVTELPFRHNLRRNIRKKTCSCDCTETCTTYRVRHYNGILEETVEKQTVISHTKMKTHMERNTAELSPVKMSSSSISYEKNTPPKNECNRKRRSEIQQLYASLSEIKWAKDFSPDNILRQFDVRQAASCSVFGRSPENKSNSSSKRSPKQSKFSSDSPKSTPTKKSHRRIKLNEIDANNPNSYTTRSKSPSSLNNTISVCNINVDRSPPVLEKSVSENGGSLKINSDHFSTYPLLSKEIMSPEMSIQSKKNSLNGNCPSNLNSIQNHFSPCNTVDLIPKRFLNFDFNSESNIDNNIENITDFSSSFLDIAEEGMRTIDACFREVGAEVVVSACFETKYELPHLTSVDTHSAESSSSVNDSPPVLEPLLSTQSCSSEISSGSTCNDSIAKDHSYNSASLKIQENSFNSTTEKLSTKFFPNIDSKSLPEKEYSPSLICFDEISTSSNSNSGHIQSTSETSSHKQETAVCDDPPILELCINTSDQNCSQEIEPKIKSGKKSCIVKNRNNCILNTINGREIERPCKTSRSFKLQRHFNSNNSDASTVDHIQLSRSLIIEAGRRIFNKYLKFARSKSKKKLPMINKILTVNGYKQDSKPLSSSSDNKEGFPVNKNSQSTMLPKISTFHRHFQQIPCSTSESVKKVLKVSSQGTSNCLNEEDDTSISLKLRQQTSESVSLPNETKILSLESHQQTVDSVDSIQNTTVIKTVNQKISYCKSPEKVTLTHNNSSFIKKKKLYKPKKQTVSCFNKATQKSLVNYNCSSSTYASTSNWKNRSPEKKKTPAVESVEVPSRVFTCQYRTIKIIHGNNYIQIILKTNRGNSIFLTHESLMELKRAICKAASDKDCRLLILNGYGKTFCLGIDLNPIVGEYKIHAVGEIANAIRDLITTLATFHKPLVAIVNGAAFGLGMTILNHADIIIATENASFCMPYSKLGYMPEGGATVSLPEAIGTTRAMDLLLKGNILTAQQAKSIGLVNEVVSLKNLPRDLVSCVRDMAERSLSTMETTKALMKMHLRIRLQEALDNEVKLLPQMWLSPSCQESILSALESELLTEWTKY